MQFRRKRIKWNNLVESKKSLSLSAHILYGSSRLGTMDYLPGQYGMHYERKGLNDYHFDSLGLAGHRPYYAFAGNQLATGEQGSNGNYYWMQQQHSGQHLINQKQYELTNHLGNVQVTVRDLPYKHENDTMTHISPALKAVYDYYPFGSPMPGRTIMDTARKCVDMTRLDRVWKAWEMTMMEIYALSLINYHLDGEGEVFIDDNGAVEVETADEHAVFYMELQDSLNNGGEMVLHVDWLKEFSEKGFQLYVQGLDATGEMRVFYQKYYKNPEDAVYLSIADSYTNVSVGIQGNVHFRIDNIRYTGGSWVNEEVLVRVCDDGGDRYRFGFNGQEKVNEIAGMGNHNTAEFWEYDTRLGRRWNVDPVDQISVSNYAVFRNNPLVFTDVDGDCVDCDENYPDAEIGDIVSPEASRLDWQKADNGEWLALGGEFNKVNVVVDGKGGYFQQQNGGNGWNATNTTLGAFGLANGAKLTMLEGGAALNRKMHISKVNNTSMIRTYGATGAKYLKYSKGLGTFGSVVTTGYAGYKMYEQFSDGGVSEVLQQ